MMKVTLSNGRLGRLNRKVNYFEGKMSKIQKKPRRKIRKRKEFPFTSRKQYADWLWYLLIKARADFTCEISGADYTEVVLNSHHLIGNGGANFNIRYSLLNGISIAQGVHRFEAHGNQLAQMRFQQQVKERRGKNIYDSLMVLDGIKENRPLGEHIDELERDLLKHEQFIKEFYSYKYTQNYTEKPKYLYLFKRFEELK